MENWGLVLYRESALLLDEEKSLLEDEFFVMLVICHEVSHSVKLKRHSLNINIFVF
jgi:aminopeptidase N